MTVNAKLVQKGKAIPRDGLVVQGHAHVELEKRYRDPLAKRGWTPALTTLLVESVAFIESERVAILDARASSKANHAREQGAIARVKTFKRMLRYAFDDLRSLEAVSKEAYRLAMGHEKLDRNTTRLLAYLTDVESTVAAHDEALEPYFGGASALAELVAARTELHEANAIQETDHAELPLETQKVYEAKGQVLTLIERMNRLAKIAFDGDAKTIGLFNKDLILRAKRTRAAEAPEVPRTEPADA